jgi:hypothetical protein
LRVSVLGALGVFGVFGGSAVYVGFFGSYTRYHKS